MNRALWNAYKYSLNQSHYNTLLMKQNFLSFSLNILNKKRYELSNHLGNVLATISDYKKPNDVNADALVDFYNAQVISSQDYYPFGAPMKERTFSSTGYRYGFNGKENDNEVKGQGNQQDYGMRIYDPRLGKFLSVDPLKDSYPWNSTYAFAENDVIRSIDLDGLEKQIVIDNSNNTGYREKLHIITGEDVIKAGHFYSVSQAMKKAGLLDDFTEIKFKHSNLSSKFIDDKIIYYANYSASWNYAGAPLSTDVSIPVSSTTFLGSSLIDYPLALLGSGIYAQAFKQTLRPLYNQAALNIKSSALNFMKNSVLTESQAARWSNLTRNNLKIKFLESTPEDLRDLIFKYNEARGLNKWGTKTYEELIKLGKSDMDIINSAANAQPSLKDVGGSIYKALGNEALPVLEKYNIAPK